MGGRALQREHRHQHSYTKARSTPLMKGHAPFFPKCLISKSLPRTIYGRSSQVAESSPGYAAGEQYQPESEEVQRPVFLLYAALDSVTGTRY